MMSICFQSLEAALVGHSQSAFYRRGRAAVIGQTLTL
jgi:hypothetical protein